MEIEDREGNTVPIRALLDTGTTASILLKQFIKKGRASSYKGQRTTWNTSGGQFQTRRKALVDFKFPELDPTKTITYVVHADDTTNAAAATYDMMVWIS